MFCNYIYLYNIFLVYLKSFFFNFVLKINFIFKTNGFIMPLIVHAVAFIYVNVNNAAGTFMKLHRLRCVSEKGVNNANE